MLGIDIKRLKRALELLLPSQRDLLRQVYIDGKEQKELAQEQGVDPTAIRNRLNKIYKRLKKFLN